MQVDPSQLLDQLNDIHGAGQPSWWPPAPGWWLLAMLALLLAALLLRQLARRLAEHRRRKAWLTALEDLNRQYDPSAQPREYLAALNRLFRAVAVRAFPRTPAPRLQGDEWVDFITSRLPPDAGNESLAALASGPYALSAEFDADQLNERARTWVKRYG
jgi:hypothetical protein